MKKRFLRMIVVSTLSFSFLFSSCIGSFSLSNRFLDWNKTIDSNKFVNAILFVVFTPAYALTMLGDVLLFNSIEFWTGENPVEAGVIKKVQGENGIYTVETLENGYRIQDEKGEESQFIYDKDTNTWSLVANDKVTKLIKIEDDKKNAVVYLPNGQESRVELSNEGLLALRQTVESSIYFAAK
ncbi:DUF3332 domain-containing protein [Dysgonomonas sp. BGC7]|uniref:DUF3332 domain-containing protein n=1 Tax=Dysgonomonas sp. BGC7 TaxID=1658008 RepID=UPI000682D822|nr:DUF3332 domain-containing protein [Dysgonomonas sp. BGC7]MBD8387336.1 DUF3332 domain-containing protein [Dysgonomonas sp. BGC7]